MAQMKRPKADALQVNLHNGGYVRLVDFMGTDLAIVQAARVSYDADWRGSDNPEEEESDARLIHYLYRNRHTSPFEQVEVKFEVQVPFFIARQWHRHRTWSYNEVSGRYTELDMGWFIPELASIGIQSAHNKQMRLSDLKEATSGMTSEERENHAANITNYAADLEAFSKQAFELYKEYLDVGIPRELARLFLPLNTYTRYYAKTDLHNLFHFLALRMHEHAQVEIRDYAKAMFELVEPRVPIACSAFRKYTLGETNVNS